MQKCEQDLILPGRFSKNAKWILFCVTLIGAVIRGVYLLDRSFTSDEVGTLIFIEKDISYLLSHFDIWLTMNYYIVIEKLIAGLFGKGSLSLGFLSLAAGIATIPLTAILAVRFTSPRVALVAAALISMNPYLIQFSAIIRSYSLLVALSTLLIILFFKWEDSKSYKYGVSVAFVSFILILTHPNGAYTIAYIGLMVVFDFFNALDKHNYLKKTVTLFLPITISGIFIFIAYYKILPEMRHGGLVVHDIPPTSISYVTYAFSEYTSGGFYGWFSAALFIAGVLVIYKYKKPLLTLLPAIFLPILLISVQGLSHYPWGYTRFLIFVVPLIIIIIAVGSDYCVIKYFPRRITLATTIMAALLIGSWLPRLAGVFDDKDSYPWHEVASFIKQNCSERDIIVGNDWVEPFHLRPYYPEKQDRIIPMSDGLHLQETTSLDLLVKVFYVTYAYTSSQLAFPLQESHFLATTQPSQYFGKIQVITYTASSEQSVLQKIRADLVNTVKGGEELAPEFTSIYRNIWDISKKLDGNDTSFCFYDLSTKCSELSERVKTGPRPLRIWLIREKMKGCK